MCFFVFFSLSVFSKTGMEQLDLLFDGYGCFGICHLEYV